MTAIRIREDLSSISSTSGEWILSWLRPRLAYLDLDTHCFAYLFIVRFKCDHQGDHYAKKDFCTSLLNYCFQNP